MTEEKLEVGKTLKLSFNVGGWSESIIHDIESYNSFLDLIDNAIDSIYYDSENKDDLSKYEITMKVEDGNLYIEDNGSGMSYEDLQKAFTVYSDPIRGKIIGKYGVGLIRSFYKLGKKFEIKSWQNKKQFSTGIVNCQELEKIEIKLKEDIVNKQGNGTRIIILDINQDLKRELNKQENLARDLGIRYGKFIVKGIKIKYDNNNINSVNLRPISIASKHDKSVCYELREKKNMKLYGDWSVSVEAGALPSTIRAEIKNSGWYIFFNDRCVLQADKTEKTSWGTGTGNKRVQNFHTEYNGFLGIVNIETKNTSTLPFNSAKSAINSEHDGYKDVVKKLSLHTKDWINFKKKEINLRKNERKENSEKILSQIIGKSAEEDDKTLPQITKKNFVTEQKGVKGLKFLKQECLFRGNWKLPKGPYVARFVETIKEGQIFKEWKNYPLASAALTRVTIELALRHVIRFLSKKPVLYKDIGTMRGLIEAYRKINIPDDYDNHKNMRDNSVNIINKIRIELNHYMHNEANDPVHSDIKEIIKKINPFINYASNLDLESLKIDSE